jgi:hypothetical protein
MNMKLRKNNNIFLKLFLLIFISVISINFASAQTDTMRKKLPVYTEPVLVGNTGVKILPPAYFEKSSSFDGFNHTGAGASIQISTTQGKPFPVMAQAMVDKTNLEKLGVQLISEEKVKTSDGKDAILIVIAFSVKGPTKTFDYERIMLLTGDYDKTIIVNANYPVLAKTILFEVVKKSVLTVSY